MSEMDRLTATFESNVGTEGRQGFHNRGTQQHLEPTSGTSVELVSCGVDELYDNAHYSSMAFASFARVWHWTW